MIPGQFPGCSGHLGFGRRWSGGRSFGFKIRDLRRRLEKQWRCDRYDAGKVYWNQEQTRNDQYGNGQAAFSVTPRSIGTDDGEDGQSECNKIDHWEN
jgi:hypothetical protein